MSVMQTWSEYVRSVVGEKSTHLDIAMRTGGVVSSSTAGRWLRGEPGTPDANKVITFADKYQRSALEALRAAGYPVGEPTARTPLAEYSNEELTEEITRRLLRKS